MHAQAHPKAGQTVKLATGLGHPQADIDGADFRLEDWWDRVTGGSWMFADGNPAALVYAMRLAMRNPPLPIDDEVVYGKVGAFGHLIHVSEIVGQPA